MRKDKIKIALIGNPNVGKSTVFNSLTGMKQHTGNWPGKTVELSKGEYEYNKVEYEICDLPGTYSLFPHSKEEEIVRDFISQKNYDIVVVVCDAVCLEKNFNLVLQILEITNNVIVCVNLMDEAKKKNIYIDLKNIQSELNTIVVGISARKKEGINELLSSIEKLSKIKNVQKKTLDKLQDKKIEEYVKRAEEICRRNIIYKDSEYAKTDRKIDKILTNRITGIPIMISLLLIILWITIYGANYPSQILFSLFEKIGGYLNVGLSSINLNPMIIDAFINGIYKVLTWVVAVMLPPMAIFFPLFTILEDLGLLTRIAFNLDNIFKKCKACGKQALTMCMGFGCNACGVSGCRIIDSPRERLIAILTNNFIPCNGRFPTLISIISMFFLFGMSGIQGSIMGVVLLGAVILIGINTTFFISRVLSKTFLKGKVSSFTLELPPYRNPEWGKVVIRSIFDRTLFVLGRAVMVAAPAGLLIWTFANINVNDISLLTHFTNLLDPFAKIIGLDGTILMAFILGLPANEIVFPIILMTYLSNGELTQISDLNAVREILVANGWTYVTAACTMMFSLMHWPCSTTLLTIYKETKSIKWTLLSMALPTLCGIVICTAINLIF